MLLLYLTTVALCFPFQVFSMTSHYMIVQSIFRPLLPSLMEQLCPPHRLNFLQPLNLIFLVWDGMTLYCYFYVVYNSVRYPKEVIKAYQQKIYLILIHYRRKVPLETLRTKKKYELISRVAAGRTPQNCSFEETQSVCACVVGICIFLCRPVLRGFAVIF